MKSVRACLALLVIGWLATTPALGSPRDAGGTERADMATASGSADGASARVKRTRLATGTSATSARSARAARSAASSSRKEPAASGPGPAAPGEDSPAPALRVLFIGNSHTARHGGMDWLVGNLAASADPPLDMEGEVQAASGVTLEYHYRNGAVERIRDGDWDVVVLQEYLPGSPAQSAEPFLEYARLLDAAIRESGARTVLFMTWPEARYRWASLDDIVAAHRTAAADLGAEVAPVGLAMQRARAERPDLAFLDWDEVHTTWEGAYLAAATLYAAIFGQSPEGLAYHLGISDDDAAFLQRIAWETVSEWRAGQRGGAAQATETPASG